MDNQTFFADQFKNTWQEGDSTRPVSILALVLAALLLAGLAQGAPDSRRVVQASEILATIERGEPVDYDGVIVEGDLDLSGLDLPNVTVIYREVEFVSPEFVSPEYDIVVMKRQIIEVKRNASLVSSPITINNSEMRGNVDFWNSAFQESVSFEATNFSADANFERARFNSTSDFNKARFSRDAWFNGAQFSRDAWFNGAQFSGDVDFIWAQFSSVANFDEAQFNGRSAWFLDANFTGDASFSRAKFNTITYFGQLSKGRVGPQFNSFANFAETQFNDETYFRANFSGYASFSGAQFNSDVDFSGTEFIETADFSNAQFRGNSATFREVNFREIAKFDESEFSGYALFEGASFNGTNTFFLTRTQFGKFHIRWKDISDNKLAYNDEVYLLLIENYKNLGWFKDADDCYYQYRKEYRSHSEMGFFAKFGDFLLEKFYGYGVRPVNALIWSAAFIVVFGLFWRGIDLSTSNRDVDKNTIIRTGCWSEVIRLVECLSFSAAVFLSGTKLFVDPPKYTNPSGKFGFGVGKFKFVIKS